MDIDLFNNATLLISMSLAHGFISRMPARFPHAKQVTLGLLFGGIAIAGMNMSVEYQTGIVYDGRSMILLISGLFGGNLVSAIAVSLLGSYRMIGGGEGVWAGLVTILVSAGIGLLARYWFNNRPEKMKLLHIWLIGLLTQVVVLGCQLLFFSPDTLQVISAIWLQVVTIFPLATVAISFLIKSELKRQQLRNRIKEDETLYRTILNSTGEAVITTNSEGKVKVLNQLAEELTGWKAPDAKGKDIGEIFHIIDETTRETVEGLVKKVVEKGKVVELANHILLVVSHGKEYPITGSVAPIGGENQKLKGIVLVFRDMTEELIGRKNEVLYANTKQFAESGSTVFEGRSSIQKQLFVTRYQDKSNNILLGGTGEGKLSDPDSQWVGDVGVMNINEKTEVEKSLKECQRHYQLLFKNNPLPMWIYDLDTLTFLMVNNAAIEKYGYTEQDFFTMTLADLLPQNDYKGSLERMKNTTEESNHAGTWQHKKKNGELINVEISSYLIDDYGCDARLVISNEVIETVKTTQVMKAGEASYWNLFENHSAIQLMIDPVSGKIINANRAAAQFYGWTTEQLKRMEIYQINTLEKGELKKRLEYAAKIKNNHFEFRHRLANGKIRDVEVFILKIEFEGKQYLHSIIHDVSLKKQAERKLRLLSKAIEQSPISIVITDAYGFTEYVNPCYIKDSGMQSHEVVGKKPNLLNSSFYEYNVFQEMWETINEGKDWEGEIVNFNKKGERYWEHVLISSLMDEENKLSNFIGIKQNITEQKKMVHDLIEAKETAVNNERLKSAFLANMSHEVRTPLNAILGFTNLVVTKESIDEKQKKEFRKIIIKSADSLLQIINDVLDAAELETKQVKIVNEPFLLNNTLSQIFLRYQQKMEEDQSKNKLKLSLLNGPPSLKINTDEIRLTQIFTNLLNNSLKFTSEGGISFGVRKIDKGCIHFVVEDSGIGIAGKDHSKIFEAFRQVNETNTRVYQGNGLGLSITKKLVELMGGKITVKSEEGNGAKFLFFLPLK